MEIWAEFSWSISAVVVEVTGPRCKGWGNNTINTIASWWEKMQSCIQRHVDTERARPCGHFAASPIEQGSYRKRARTLSWPDSEKHQGKVPWPQNWALLSIELVHTLALGTGSYRKKKSGQFLPGFLSLLLEIAGVGSPLLWVPVGCQNQMWDKDSLLFN